MRASRRVLLGVAAAVPAAFTVAAPAPSASAAPPPPAPDPPPDEYCATALLSPSEIAADARSSIQCYETFDESLLAIGVDPAPVGTARSAAEATTSASGLVAVHYDNINGVGKYLAIGGSACDGGGITFNPGDEWDNRIRSTAPRACSTMKHWSETNNGGEIEITSGPTTQNLSSLAGRVSSVRYYA